MIDINKKYRTRACAEVRIYALDGGGLNPVQGAIKNPGDGVWVLSRWNEQGRISSSSNFSVDLIEVKPRIKQTVWLAVYPLDDIWVVSGDCTAVEKGCLACVKVEIDCEEGEGL